MDTSDNNEVGLVANLLVKKFCKIVHNMLRGPKTFVFSTVGPNS